MTNNYPNFFIPGAAKSGTSTLHELLNFHPDICMSSEKEPYFWVRKDFDLYTKREKEWYNNLFNAKPNALKRGESTTAYMLFPGFIEAISTHLNPDELKFIFILRNPVKRAYSHYWYLKGIGSETLEFKPAVLNDIDEPPQMNTMLAEGKYKHYYQYGLYGKWLKPFYDQFNSNQIKVILFEDLKANPETVANSCFQFLGLSTLSDIPKIHSNKTVILKAPHLHRKWSILSQNTINFFRPTFKYFPRQLKDKFKKLDVTDIIPEKTNAAYPKLDPMDKQWLSSLYANDAKLLEQLTNQSFDHWFKTAEVK
ncbi:MAG: hypothetical protein BM564_00650 [Bacteroidetes bacterium MedPE-SWsnd-G2]|nr:MAG: hypothetical protein BM564_00650 [Bacteroidetes bacterium MedPE-SWsnd-G2]